MASNITEKVNPFFPKITIGRFPKLQVRIPTLRLAAPKPDFKPC
jgi:hypothetical protein